jgi:glycerol-3-phosphate O-acyltransferase
VNDVLNTPDFEAILCDLSRHSGIPVDKLRAEAALDLNEMATRPGKYTVAGWDRFCRWLARAYQLDFDPNEVRFLQELNRESALIFLPNHRSYLDPLVLRSALARFEFPPNSILGGSNLALWPLSTIGQRSGIVFIRREFRDDPLYRAVLKTYLAYLIQHRKNLEWYIEGGRTRTGKLRPTRYGILSYVLDAVANQPEHDVHIVPTSIVYDQQHEVTAISAEEMGGIKSAESIGWLYAFAKSQSRRLGRVHLRFGKPLSVHDALNLTTDDEGRARPRLAVPKVAFEVANRINSATPITPSALITFALLDNGARAITVEEGRLILQPLLEYIQIRRIPVTGDLELSDHGLLRDSFDNLVREKVITTYQGGNEAVFMIELEHQHEAAFYRNTTIHWFLTRAITEVALVQAAHDEGEDIKAATWRNARQLKDMLKFEFFFPTTQEFAAAVAAETSILYPDWESTDFTSETILALLADLKLHLAHRVVGPFLEAYSVLADELASIPAHIEIDEADLVSRSLGIARQRWLQKGLHTPESISKDYFRNAYRLAANKRLIETSEPDLERRRKAFATDLRATVRRIDDIRQLAQGSGQPVLIERARPMRA